MSTTQTAKPAAPRITELQTRVAFSAFYVANKMNSFESRYHERKALRAWQRSLAAFGVDSSIDACIRARLAALAA